MNCMRYRELNGKVVVDCSCELQIREIQETPAVVDFKCLS
jgi:hypothetical protein